MDSPQARSRKELRTALAAAGRKDSGEQWPAAKRPADSSVSKPTAAAVPLADTVERTILLIRPQRVVLDLDLAMLYGVETKVMNRAVRRNAERFPADFMFQPTPGEAEILRCQIGTSRWGGRRSLPLAFTEQGIAMLSGVLRSARAIEVNIAIMRAFARLRQVLTSHADLGRKLEELERRMTKNDSQLQVAFDAIRRRMLPQTPDARPRIGFRRRRDAGRRGRSARRRLAHPERGASRH
jgi:hypothetical protein